MFRAIDTSPDVDLSQFSRLLWQQGIAHRIVQQGQGQLLLVAREEQILPAVTLYGCWQRGEVQPQAGADGRLDLLLSGASMTDGVARALRQTPLTLILIAVCVALLFVAPLDRPTDLTYSLLYPDFSRGTRVIVLSRVIETFGIRDFFNMLSPIVLHGGVLHLVFNMLWLWELGRRIELRQSGWLLGLVIVLLALVSNTVQYLYGGGNNFGGMSGVVYGLFAWIWMWQLFCPAAGLRLPGSLILFMLLSLVLMTWLGLSMIANEAHLGGFVGGVVFGAVAARLSRLRRAAA